MRPAACPRLLSAWACLPARLPACGRPAVCVCRCLAVAAAAGICSHRDCLPPLPFSALLLQPWHGRDGDQRHSEQRVPVSCAARGAGGSTDKRGRRSSSGSTAAAANRAAAAAAPAASGGGSSTSSERRRRMSSRGRSSIARPGCCCMVHHRCCKQVAGRRDARPAGGLYWRAAPTHRGGHLCGGSPATSDVRVWAEVPLAALIRLLLGKHGRVAALFGPQLRPSRPGRCPAPSFHATRGRTSQRVPTSPSAPCWGYMLPLGQATSDWFKTRKYSTLPPGKRGGLFADGIASPAAPD